MFALPADFPLKAYVGRRVARVIEGPHYVSIEFETSQSDAASVQFEGPVVAKFEDGTEREIRNKELSAGSKRFQPLVDAAVLDVQRISEASCKFEFSNGWSLTLLGEKGGYESYHLHVAGRSCDV